MMEGCEGVVEGCGGFWRAVEGYARLWRLWRLLENGGGLSS